MVSAKTLSDRRGLWAFVLGVLLVTSGVLAHVPMFLMGRMTHYRLDGMPVGIDMIAGMGAIVLGVAVTAYSLLPRNISSQLAASRSQWRAAQRSVVEPSAGPRLLLRRTAPERLEMVNS